MQSILERKNTENITSSVREYLNKLNTAGVKEKCEIENKMVNMGEMIIPELVSQIQTIKGTIRGVVAMTLIRIGEPAVKFINEAANNNKDFEWVANYLIAEINGKKAA